MERVQTAIPETHRRTPAPTAPRSSSVRTPDRLDQREHALTVLHRAPVVPSDFLTYRELEVLEIAGRGLSVKSIAKALGISHGTVKWHLKNCYQKLGAASREDALRRARADGLIGMALVCEVCACALDLRRTAA